MDFSESAQNPVGLFTAKSALNLEFTWSDSCTAVKYNSSSHIVTQMIFFKALCNHTWTNCWFCHQSPNKWLKYGVSRIPKIINRDLGNIV